MLMAVVAALVQQSQITKRAAVAAARQALVVLELRARAEQGLVAVVEALMEAMEEPTALTHLAADLAAAAGNLGIKIGLLGQVLTAAAAAALHRAVVLLAALPSTVVAVVVGVAAPQHPLAAHQPMVAQAVLALPLLQLLELPLLAAAAVGLPLALVLAAKFVSGSFAKGLTNVSVRS
jgi:hypothetical protein